MPPVPWQRFDPLASGPAAQVNVPPSTSSASSSGDTNGASANVVTMPGCTVAVLTEGRRLRPRCNRTPGRASLGAASSRGQRAGHDVCDPCSLGVGEPFPAAEERDHVAGVPVHRPEPGQHAAVEVLVPQRSEGRVLEVIEQAPSLRREHVPPARLACHRVHVDASQHRAREAPHQLTDRQRGVPLAALVHEVGDIGRRSGPHGDERGAQIALAGRRRAPSTAWWRTRRRWPRATAAARDGSRGACASHQSARGSRAPRSLRRHRNRGSPSRLALPSSRGCDGQKRLASKCAAASAAISSMAADASNSLHGIYRSGTCREGSIIGPRYQRRTRVRNSATLGNGVSSMRRSFDFSSTLRVTASPDRYPQSASQTDVAHATRAAVCKTHVPRFSPSSHSLRRSQL